MANDIDAMRNVGDIAIASHFADRRGLSSAIKMGSPIIIDAHREAA